MTGHIMACFFYGVVSTLLIGGYISDKYGGRKLILISFAVQIMCTILTPILLLNEPYMFFPNRIIQGMCAVSIFRFNIL